MGCEPSSAKSDRIVLGRVACSSLAAPHCCWPTRRAEREALRAAAGLCVGSRKWRRGSLGRQRALGSATLQPFQSRLFVARPVSRAAGAFAKQAERPPRHEQHSAERVLSGPPEGARVSSSGPARREAGRAIREIEWPTCPAPAGRCDFRRAKSDRDGQGRGRAAETGDAREQRPWLSNPRLSGAPPSTGQACCGRCCWPRSAARPADWLAGGEGRGQWLRRRRLGNARARRIHSSRAPARGSPSLLGGAGNRLADNWRLDVGQLVRRRRRRPLDGLKQPKHHDGGGAQVH